MPAADPIPTPVNTPAAPAADMPWPCKLILYAFALPASVLLVAAVAWLFFGVRFGGDDGPAVIWFFFSLLGAVAISGMVQTWAVWRAERHFESIPEQRTGRISAVIVAGMCSVAFAGMYLLIFALTWRQ